MNFSLSDEQNEILSCDGDLKVNATAGSGKTTTLALKAKLVEDDPVLILTFNKAAKYEVENKCREFSVNNVTAEHVHSLAYRNTFGKKKVKIGDLQVQEIIAFLGIREVQGSPVNSVFLIANYIILIVKYFCSSLHVHVTDLTPDDFKELVIDNFFFKNFEKLISYADRIFEAIQDQQLAMPHDAYLKMYWAKGHQLPYGHIYFDEIQDASPVMLDLMLRQNCTKVIVGDEHQQIYSFRYSDTNLKNLDFDEYALSTSFRFGNSIALAATDLLKLKERFGIPCEINEVKGFEVPSVINGYTAVIARTNLGLFNSAIKLINQNSDFMKNIYFEGDLNHYNRSDSGVSISDVYHLYKGERSAIVNTMLKSIQTFDRAKEYALQTSDYSLQMLCSMIETYKDELPRLINELKKRVGRTKKEESNLIFTTAHKAKGMEYDEVYICDDFMTIKNMESAANEARTGIARIREELNLIYVSLTRSKGVAAFPEDLIY
ncbi:MAG: UvrD-helicase domain-containing protein [Cyclobacteriaceae bacterium]